MRNDLRVNKVGAALQSLVGAILVGSGLVHICSPFHFAETVSKYNILDEFSINFVTLFLPSTQIVTGMGLLVGGPQKWFRFLGMLIFGSFVIAQSKVLFSGEKISCGCFGMYSHEVGWGTIWLPLVCFLICCIPNHYSSREPSQSVASANAGERSL